MVAHHKRPPRLTADAKADIVARYRTDEPVGAIAVSHGINASWVWRIARAAGAPPRPKIGYVAAKYVHPGDAPLPEHPMLAEMQADPDWTEIAPRQFVTTAVFRKYRAVTGWRDIRPQS